MDERRVATADVGLEPIKTTGNNGPGMTRLFVTSGTNYCVYIYEPSLLYDDALHRLGWIDWGQKSIPEGLLRLPNRNNNEKALNFRFRCKINFEWLAADGGCYLFSVFC